MSKSKHPPKLPHRFFRWYCHRDFLEDIEGDLLERFEATAEEKGLKSAQWSFTKDVIRLFRPSLIRPLEGTQKLNHYGMLKNNIKIGCRSLIKRKESAIINTLGLAIGIASTLLLLLFIQNEFSYDKSFKDSDRIFKMVQEIRSAEEVNMYSTVPYPLVSIMTEDYAEVEAGTAISGPYDGQVVFVKDENDKQVNFIENQVILADSNFFSVFSYKMLRGNRKTCLISPNSVVLTESTAKKYFGDSDPIGQFISPSGKNSIVTGVCADPPANSHLQFNYIVSSSSVNWFSQPTFNLRSAHCYFKLREGVQAKNLELKLPKLIETYVLEEIEKTKSISKEDYKKAGNGFEYFLKPLTSLHLSEDKLGGFEPGGNLVTLQILMAIALLILIIACINFMNLSTARATERSKEVGVRKVMGSLKTQLVFQFLIESLIISLVSVILGIVITIIALPYFNALTNSSLELAMTLKAIGVFLGAVVVLGLVAGIYPAFVLSSFKPVNALKGYSISNSRNGLFRNGLVLFQFWVTIVLVVSTFIIHKQIQHLREKDLGFDKEQLMVIEGISHKETSLYLPFLNEVKNLSQISGAAGSLWVQGFQGTWVDNYKPEESAVDFNIKRVLIGDDYAEVMGFELTAGELFSESTNDSLNIILNESAVKKMGLNDPIGQKIHLRKQENSQMKEISFTVKGVIKDFHYASLHEEVQPLVIQSNEIIYGRIRYIIAKMRPGAGIKTISSIENKWNELLPGRPFRFRFLDDTLEAKYQNDKRTATILTIFSVLTIFIACLGLFALSSYTINMRLKEIGIRKILGAKVQAVVFLLSKDFARMLLVSFLLATPVAWYASSGWLENFAYRTDITLELFILPGMLITLVLGLTVSVQTFRAANTNPVDSLRNE